MRKIAAGMQKKVWQIQPESGKAAALAESLKISALTAQILINRDLHKEDIARSFLSPKLTELIDPERMHGIGAAAEQIRAAIEAGKKISIYGDYDVDGITSVSILWHLLKIVGAAVDYYIPHRADEGYGLNADAVRQLADNGTELMITVDCGITGVDQVRLAHELGIEVILTDHHEPGEHLPEAEAIVHPRLDADYGNPHAAGAMVAFKLAWAIANRYKKDAQLPPELKQYLLNATTLAALGTIADMVDLRGENRVLAGYGLKALENSSLVGIQALVETAQVQASGVDSYAVAFRLAPMLNAAGRMGHARLAVELLTTDSKVRAMQIAGYLKDQNRLRQKCQRDIFKQAKQRITQTGLNHPDRKTIVLSDENWHTGVIGIVASKVIDTYYRPTIMINASDGIGKGSGRSVAGFDLHGALTACGGHLISFGGHKMAAGLKIDMDNIAAFAEAFEAYAHENMEDGTLDSYLDIDAEARIVDFNEGVMRELNILEPFGAGNPKPLFAARGVKLIAPPRTVGSRNDHLQISISDDSGAVRCIGFGMGKLEKKLLETDRFSVAFEPQYNTYNGRTNLQFVLSDIQFE
ncbi:MAG: single-stranded-DNA-specific exonuclease RecJ [Planctomycetota bacterium]|nr:MAG: single-stranded-DNA-specific exonuclease RecJ [Planctomycetota bacterium]